MTREDVTARALRELVPRSGGPRLDETWLENSIYVVASMLRRDVDDILACAAEGDRAVVELAALAVASETGRDPPTSDALTPSLFEKPWRDRLTDSPVTFHRDVDGKLVAEGPVVEFLHSLESERDATGPSEK